MSALSPHVAIVVPFPIARCRHRVRRVAKHLIARGDATRDAVIAVGRKWRDRLIRHGVSADEATRAAKALCIEVMAEIQRLTKRCGGVA